MQAPMASVRPQNIGLTHHHLYMCFSPPCWRNSCPLPIQTVTVSLISVLNHNLFTPQALWALPSPFRTFQNPLYILHGPFWKHQTHQMHTSSPAVVFLLPWMSTLGCPPAQPELSEAETVLFVLFCFAVLGFELRAYILSHLTSPSLQWLFVR
jgi:hypothetical protein